MSRLQQEGWAVGVLEALRDQEKLAEEDAAKEDAEGEGEELAMTQKLPEAEEEQQEQPADDEQPGSEPGSPGSPKRMLVRMETFSDELVAHGDVSPEDDTNLDVPRLQEAFYHFKVPDSFDIDVNDLAEVMHHLGHIKMTREEALEIAKEVGDYDMLEYDEFLKWAQKFVYREKSRLQEALRSIIIIIIIIISVSRILSMFSAIIISSSPTTTITTTTTTTTTTIIIIIVIVIVI